MTTGPDPETHSAYASRHSSLFAALAGIAVRPGGPDAVLQELCQWAVTLAGADAATAQVTLGGRPEFTGAFEQEAAQGEWRSSERVPLSSHGRRIGSLTIGSQRQRTWEQADLEALQVVADVAAERIANELTAATTPSEEPLLRRVADASLNVANAEDPALAVCRVARTVTTAVYSCLLLPDKNGELMRLAQDGADVPSIAYLIGRATGAAGATESERLKVISDLRLLDDAQELLTSFRRAGLSDVRGCLFVPLPSRDGTGIPGMLGVLFDRTLSAGDAATLSAVDALAIEAALAIERTALYEVLRAEARTDPLTGASNRRAWDDHLPNEMARAARHESPLSVVMLDLDRFKHYNDHFGHHAGDILLQQSVAAWQSQLRPGDLLARVGGEEFALILPATRAEDAVRLCDRLRGLMQPGVTVSVGVAGWDFRESPTSVYDRADAAMYEAKRHGGDQVVISPPPVPEQRPTSSETARPAE